MPKTSPDSTALEPAVVLLDACVLYPFHLRNILIQIAADRLMEARWTDAIQQEWSRNLLAALPSISDARLRETRRLMNQALPQARVSGYEPLIDDINLPDPDDRHVVAAGVASGASVILTWNLRDFPVPELRRHGLTVRTPDVFLSSLHDMAPELMTASLSNARRNLGKSALSGAEFIDVLKTQRLVRLAERLGNHIAAL